MVIPLSGNTLTQGHDRSPSKLPKTYQTLMLKKHKKDILRGFFGYRICTVPEEY